MADGRPPGGRSPRRKGDRLERELAKLLGGQRVPLSGAAGGEFSGDVHALGLTWQVKARKDGWRTLYAALQGADALALKADRRLWLVVLPLEKLLGLMQHLKRGAGSQCFWGLAVRREGDRVTPSRL